MLSVIWLATTNMDVRVGEQLYQGQALLRRDPRPEAAMLPGVR